MSQPLSDEVFPVNVVSSEVVYAGIVWDIRRDMFEYGDTVPAETITREYVDHTGAVAILALDDQDRVLLIKQYRHPVGAREWEIPAGLLDIDGESPVLGAQRELAEEADVVASEWNLLSDFYSTPGGSNEAIRIYLARGLSDARSVFERTDEESDIEKRWVPLDEVVAAVLGRTVGNSILSIAVLTAQVSRAAGWASLGAADAPWSRHPKSHSRD
ncbi:NUDIX hydrolase [Glaciihabitans sp. INWT7]|uniref:NUDIX domain-containing protein n=1 Tax=Glaciihabitans sp. INWT7 TaxID=2596912 RepID=UPI00162332BE|nr:NUDIX hydrolase [Glaciihabitans sp. INWT7]QNE48389.1 NUDIX hydrolase [Glaciihabitans sp. INWT7]